MEAGIDNHIRSLIPLFLPSSPVLTIAPLGDGNINSTYLITFSNRRPAVLQRINGTVFPRPDIVADNVKLVTDYIRDSQPAQNSLPNTLEVIPALSGRSHVIDGEDEVWRLVEYIDNSLCYTSIPTVHQAERAGAVLGWFHRRLNDFNPEYLRVPLPGFHDLPAYFDFYERVKTVHRRPSSKDLTYCCQQAEMRGGDRHLLHHAHGRGKIQTRVIHGDPKVGNILFDKQSGEPVAIIDLDTVSSGLAQYDIGDALRSFCNKAGEDPENPEAVVFNLDICVALLSGYCSGILQLPSGERELIYQGVRLMTLELAIRFLSDYLDNDRYFKVSDEQENLRRSLVQFHLLHSIEKQQAAIENIAQKVC